MNQETRWKNRVQALMNAHHLNFPRLDKYMAGGQYGAIFTTTNGRLVKITPGNASFEFDALKRLNRTGFVPRAYQKAVVKFNGPMQRKSIMLNLFINRPSTNSATLYVMNKIDGIELSKYLKNGGQWGPREQRELNRITHVMHSSGVIHGDFHTGNILVTLNNDGSIKKFYVIDFGLGMFKKLGQRTANVLSRIPKANNTNVESNRSNCVTSVAAHGSRLTRNNRTLISACLRRN
jgi:serine/threonine protein kinase